MHRSGRMKRKARAERDGRKARGISVKCRASSSGQECDLHTPYTLLDLYISNISFFGERNERAGQPGSPEQMSGVLRVRTSGRAAAERGLLTPTSPYWPSTTASLLVVGQCPFFQSNCRKGLGIHCCLPASAAYKIRPRDEAGSRCVYCGDRQQRSRGRFHAP